MGTRRLVMLKHALVLAITGQRAIQALQVQSRLTNEILNVGPADTAPRCDPDDKNEFSWYTCGLESDKWFGVSFIKRTWEQAKSECAKAQDTYVAEIMAVPNQNIDVCAYYALNMYSGGREMGAVYSGKFSALAGERWYWCPNDDNAGVSCMETGYPMTYMNWNHEPVITEPTMCMGGKVEAHATSFYDYGWRTYGCKQVDQE